ncbi:hypothetical protein PVAP13_1NG346119 [Panicum virgatum]|uniref:Uncharacterized protein n=1 Tax=Panicum virgatum TaxID=38727 RepID=A0A8T0X0U2_PANVG|nr:hypothetical protein PVAP13_1NG346119 [Panicum virgatum]
MDQEKQRRPKVQNLVTQRTAGRILIEPAAQRLQMLTSRRKKNQEKKSLRCGWARAADQSTEIKKHHWMRMQLQVGEAIDDTLRPWMDMEVTPGCSASQPNN